MSHFTKVFILLLALVFLFKIEFYPFSNYQMYSGTLLPKKHYTFYKFYGVKGDKRIPFDNRKFGFFHSERPFIESFLKNSAAKGEKTFLSGVYNSENVKSEFDYLEVYRKRLDWHEYKNSLLVTGQAQIRVKKSELIARYPDAE